MDLFAKFGEARETFEAVYLGSPRFRWALWLTAYAPWILVAVGYLFTVNTDQSTYAALTNAVTSGIRIFLPFLALTAMIKLALRAASIFRQEEQRLYDIR